MNQAPLDAGPIGDGGGRRLVFVGDSVTDADRGADPDGLGSGYVRMIAAAPRAAGRTVVNRGVSGNRVRDLRQRWSSDVLPERADVLTVLIGVNDTGRRFDSDDPTSAESFEEDYREVLRQSADGRTRLVLMNPFVLPVLPGQQQWLDDLNEKIRVVERLAREFEAGHVALDRVLADAASVHGAAALAEGGVHPTALRHQPMARAWVDAGL